MDRQKGKKAVTILLVLSCVISGIILAATKSPEVYRVKTHQQLDSLITQTVLNSQIKPPQIRVNEITVDSIFTRREYQIKVPTRFSKTLFHLELNNRFSKYNMEVPATVHFPERDMDIYIYNKGTILSTIRLVGDARLDTLIIGVN